MVNDDYTRKHKYIIIKESITIVNALLSGMKMPF